MRCLLLEARCKGLLHIILFLVVVSMPGSVIAADSRAEQVLKAVVNTHRLPTYVSFAQDVQASGLLGSWRFSSTVVRDGEKTQVSAPGAPALFPVDFLADLADFTKAMSGFDIKYNGRVTLDGKYECELLQGTRRAGIYTGATSGSIWVDAATFIIRQIKLKYTWGTVEVDQTYERKGEYLVLSRQEAKVSPYGMRLTVQYRDYTFKP